MIEYYILVDAVAAKEEQKQKDKTDDEVLIAAQVC